MAELATSFGAFAEAYARARPRYPDAIYDWVAARCPDRALAWDCATGNGQAALGLASRFGRVHASDASAEQIAHASPAPGVTYAVEPAEASTLATASVDAIVVAQALHWFDYSRFWAEVARVARPGALFAAWGYAWPVLPPAIELALHAPFRALVEPYWAPQNRILWDGYRDADIGLPFARVDAPRFEIRTDWTIGQLIGYLTTWSAYQRARPQVGDALDVLLGQASALAPADHTFAVCMPLSLVAARVEHRVD